MQFYIVITFGSVAQVIRVLRATAHTALLTILINFFVNCLDWVVIHRVRFSGGELLVAFISSLKTPSAGI